MQYGCGANRPFLLGRMIRATPQNRIIRAARQYHCHKIQASENNTSTRRAYRHFGDRHAHRITLCQAQYHHTTLPTCAGGCLDEDCKDLSFRDHTLRLILTSKFFNINYYLKISNFSSCSKSQEIITDVTALQPGGLKGYSHSHTASDTNELHVNTSNIVSDLQSRRLQSCLMQQPPLNKTTLGPDWNRGTGPSKYHQPNSFLKPESVMRLAYRVKMRTDPHL